MKPSFALNLSTEGIGLFHRAGDGWQLVGEASLENPDLGRELEFLRRTAAGLEPGGITSKLVIPNSQVLYRTIEVDSKDTKDRADAVRAAMDGATPYALDQLAIDWQPTPSGRIAIAACARETLREAETFAEDNRFNPVSFVARPDSPEDFPTEPFFGEARAAAALLEPGARVERDLTPIPVGPKTPEPAAAEKVEVSKEPQPAPAPVEDARFDQPAPKAPAKPGKAPPPRRRRLSILQQAESMPARSQVILGLLLIVLAVVLWVSVVMRETITGWILPHETTSQGTVVAAARHSPPDAPSAEAVQTNEALAASDPKTLNETSTAQLATSTAGVTAHKARMAAAGLLEAHHPGKRAVKAPGPVEQLVATGTSAAALRVAADKQLRSNGLTATAAELVAWNETSSPAPTPEPLIAAAGALAPEGLTKLAGLRPKDLVGSVVTQPDRAETAVGDSLGARQDVARLTGTDVTPETTDTATASAEAPKDAATQEPDAAAAARAGAQTEPPAQQGSAANQTIAALAPPDGSPLGSAGIDAGAGASNNGPTDTSAGAGADAATNPSPDGGAIAVIRPPLVPGRTEALDAPPGPQIAEIRPPLRPAQPVVASADVNAAVSAALDTNAEAAADEGIGADLAALRPRRRPKSVGQQNAVTASNASVAPRVPSNASVSREATDRNALRIQRVMLLGTLGQSSNRSALIKVGRDVEKVKVGDEIDGGQVTAISATALTYVKYGQQHVLTMPKPGP